MLQRKLNNQNLFKESFKPKRSPGQLKGHGCLHCVSELGFRNLVFASCCKSAGESHVCLCPARVSAFAWADLSLEERALLGSCCCHGKLVCVLCCEVLAARSSCSSSRCTTPRVRRVAQWRDGLCLVFPSWANQASRLCCSSHNLLAGTTRGGLSHKGQLLTYHLTYVLTLSNCLNM